MKILTCLLSIHFWVGLLLINPAAQQEALSQKPPKIFNGIAVANIILAGCQFLQVLSEAPSDDPKKNFNDTTTTFNSTFDFANELAQDSSHFLHKGVTVGKEALVHVALRFDMLNVSKEIDRTCTMIQQMVQIQPFLRDEVFNDRIHHSLAAKTVFAIAKQDYLMAKNEFDRQDAMRRMSEYVENNLKKDSKWNFKMPKETLYRGEETIANNLIHSCHKLREDFLEIMLVWFEHEHIELLMNNTGPIPTSKADLDHLARFYTSEVKHGKLQMKTLNETESMYIMYRLKRLHQLNKLHQDIYAEILKIDIKLHLNFLWQDAERRQSRNPYSHLFRIIIYNIIALLYHTIRLVYDFFKYIFNF